MNRMARPLMAMLVSGLLVAAAPRPAAAIQGCTLNDPDRDIRRLFPASTDYRTMFIALSDRGGDADRSWLASRLGVELDPVYEAVDLPYAYYEVLKGKEVLGFVFGVNQKGRYGGMQVILATDPKGVIIDAYFQKLSTPARKAFVAESFIGQFKGLSLKDFYFHQGYRDMGKTPDADRIAAIAPPKDDGDATAQDFRATLRGVKKALILFDHFWLGDQHEATWRKVRTIVDDKDTGGNTP
jgi:hypothetical protein